MHLSDSAMQCFLLSLSITFSILSLFSRDLIIILIDGFREIKLSRNIFWIAIKYNDAITSVIGLLNRGITRHHDIINDQKGHQTRSPY